METSLGLQTNDRCPFTSRLLEAIDSPVEKCRELYRQRLRQLLGHLQAETDVAVLKIKLSEPALQRKILYTLKNDLSQKTDSLAMPADRRSYLLHQLANAQDAEELALLIHQINTLQIQQCSVVLRFSPNLSELMHEHRQDLLFLAQTRQGICITKQSFSRIAGIYGDGLNAQELLELKVVTSSDSISILNQKLMINETLLSSLESIELKGKKLSHSIVAIMGTTGNLISMISDMIAGKISKLILMHHSPLDLSLKFQKNLVHLIQTIVASDYDSHLARVIKSYWEADMDLMHFLEIPEIKMVLTASNDLNSLKQADIILLGNCPTSSFMTLDHFKLHTVLIEMTSTPIFDRNMIKKMESLRPDLSYHQTFKLK